MKKKREMGKFENREEMDWALFNLLEGNLTESEVEQLEAKIAESDELQEEWEGMQTTLLPEESIVYTKKSSLIKEEKAIFVLAWWKKPLQMAAAIAALLILSIPLFNMYNDDPASIATSAIEPKNETAATELAENIETTPITTDLNVLPASDESNQESASEHKHSINKRKTMPSETESRRVKNRAVIEPSPIDQREPLYAVVENDNRDVVQGITAKSTQFSFASYEEGNTTPMEPARYLPVSNDIEPLTTGKTYKGLRNSLNQGLAALARPIRNTKIKVNKTGDKKDPGLQFEVTTDQYYAVAMVHLLPRNNR